MLHGALARTSWRRQQRMLCSKNMELTHDIRTFLRFWGRRSSLLIWLLQTLQYDRAAGSEQCRARDV